MLDLHAVSSGGSLTSLATIGTILLGGDGATVAGVPITTTPQPTLVGWGGLTTIADTIQKMALVSQDQLDPINNQSWLGGTTSVKGIIHFWDNLPYRTGARAIQMAQVTAAANNMGYTIDHYPGGPVQDLPFYGKPSGNGLYSTTSGALTAITWKQVAFAPTTAMPAGKYAILGAYADALTNYGLLRFRHADFGQFAPGFPIVDNNLAAARAVANDNDLLWNNGYQFVTLSKLLQVPCCPVFTVTNQGTGLNLEGAAITADTPIWTINLAKVG